MKKIWFFGFLTVLISTIDGWSQIKAEDILGSWVMPADKESGHNIDTLVEIFEHNGKFYGYGYAYLDGSVNHAKDSQNSDPALRDRDISDVIFLYELVFDGKEWTDGEIYRPKDGKYFYNRAKLSNDKSKLILRSTVDKAGVFGITQAWSRLADTAKFDKLKKPKNTLISLLSTVKKHKK